MNNIKNLTFKELYPNLEWDWLILVGLIHDLGKVLALPEWESLNQWFVVGDTFPVGIKLDTGIIFYELSDKYTDSILYPGEFGSYSLNIGLDNLIFSFSHDNYLFDILNNQSKLPFEALYIIKYHSFYPWVNPKVGFMRSYQNLVSENDWYHLPLLKMFQKADLYSKDENIPDIDKIKPYYKLLIDKYIPGKINW